MDSNWASDQWGGGGEATNDYNSFEATIMLIFRWWTEQAFVKLQAQQRDVKLSKPITRK